MDPLVNIERGGIVGLLVFFVVLLMRRDLVPGAQYRQIVAERDWWKERHFAAIDALEAATRGKG